MGSCGLIIRIRVEELLKTGVTGVSTTMAQAVRPSQAVRPFQVVSYSYPTLINWTILTS